MQLQFRYLVRPLIIGLILALAGCYTNPVTGRQYAVMTSLGEELQLGAQAFTEVKRTEAISRDPAANARVQRVGKRIAAAVGNQLPGAQWEFVVFQSNELNAFALPGGKRMTEAPLVGLVGTAGAIAVDRKYGSDKSELFLLAYGGISTVGYVLPHSRGDESEADLMGLQYAAAAGYDPAAAVTVWQKMAQAAGPSKTPVWLSTHPSNSQRIATLRAAAPRYHQLYLANKARYE